MRKLVALGIFTLLFGTGLIAQTPLYFAWDYPDSGIADVSHFRVKYDSGQYTSVGLPTPEVLEDTAPGNHTFRTLLPTGFQPGANHTASVVACSDTMGCSFEVSLPFRLIGPASNPRIKK